MHQSSTALTELGLSEHESLLYLTLLRTGGATASQVAKDAGIKRTSVYALLRALAQKGFVTQYHRKSRQLFYAEKPQRVVTHYSKKIHAFEALVPTLESLSKKQIQVTGIRFIETLPELKRFYGDILDLYRNKQYCIIGDLAAWEGLDPTFFTQFRKNRAAAKIRTKLLLTTASKQRHIDDASLLRDVKYLPEKYEFKSTIDIFKDRVLIVNPELSSLAVVIEIPAMTDVFESIFALLWDASF